MASTVEDGEILELDGSDGEVIDLCSDGDTPNVSAVGPDPPPGRVPYPVSRLRPPSVDRAPPSQGAQKDYFNTPRGLPHPAVPPRPPMQGYVQFGTHKLPPRQWPIEIRPHSRPIPPPPDEPTRVIEPDFMQEPEMRMHVYPRSVPHPPDQTVSMDTPSMVQHSEEEGEAQANVCPPREPLPSTFSRDTDGVLRGPVQVHRRQWPPQQVCVSPAYDMPHDEYQRPQVLRPMEWRERDRRRGFPFLGGTPVARRPHRRDWNEASYCAFQEDVDADQFTRPRPARGVARQGDGLVSHGRSEVSPGRQLPYGLPQQQPHFPGWQNAGREDSPQRQKPPHVREGRSPPCGDNWHEEDVWDRNQNGTFSQHIGTAPSVPEPLKTDPRTRGSPEYGSENDDDMQRSRCDRESSANSIGENSRDATRDASLSSPTSGESSFSPSPEEQDSNNRPVSPGLGTSTTPPPSTPPSTSLVPSAEAKKDNSKKSLAELRRKALLSIKKKPAEKLSSSDAPQARKASDAVPKDDVQQSSLPRVDDGARSDSHSEALRPSAPRDSASPVPQEVLAPPPGMSVDALVELNIGGIRRLMTRAEYSSWRLWPYENRVVVEFSSDSSDSETESASSDSETEGHSNTIFRRPHRRLSRSEEIEDMKIRMVRLGKCPSVLYGGSGQYSRSVSLIQWSVFDGARDGADVVDRKKSSSLPKNAKSASDDAVVHHSEHSSSVDGNEESNPNTAQASQSPQPATPGRVDDEQTAPCGGKGESDMYGERHHIAGAMGSVPADDHTKKSQDGTVSPGCSKGNVIPHEEQRNGASLVSESSKQISPPEDALMELDQPREQVVANKHTLGIIRKPDQDPLRPIADLKRRIAELEKDRVRLKEQSNKKRRTVRTESESSKATDGSRKQSAQKDVGAAVKSCNRRSPILPLQQSCDDKHHLTAQDRKRGTPYDGRTRYYAQDESKKLLRRSLSPIAVPPREVPGNDATSSIEQPSSSSAAVNTQGAWNQRHETRAAQAQPADSIDRGYIKDLEYELEKKKKELDDERSRTDQIKAADVAVAEAHVRVSYKRGRVRDLEEQLVKARQEVVNAEEQHRNCVRVAYRLRGLEDGDDDPAYPGQLPLFHEESKARELHITPQSDDAKPPAMEEEEGKEADLILQPSPYSPSKGARYTSCLSGFRAYAYVSHTPTPA